jgi:ATP-dependent helicase HrpB
MAQRAMARSKIARFCPWSNRGYRSNSKNASTNMRPSAYRCPADETVKIAYTADAPPLIAARIQDLYGIKEGLWIANRRVPVRIQVLAPSNRPVQVTDNLSLFWRETYPKLKTQLQRRYPKHEWR